MTEKLSGFGDCDVNLAGKNSKEKEKECTSLAVDGGCEWDSKSHMYGKR